MPVTVVGDAFIDIIVSTNNIRPGETYYRNMAVACGGTANVAILISKLGEQAKFVGTVGSDALGRYFKEHLRRCNVIDLTLSDNEHPSGLCLSLIYKYGERSMIANRGANDYLTKAVIEGYIGEIVNSEIAYFSGYSLLSGKSSEAVLFAMKECRQHNCEVWFNPGAPNIVTKKFLDVIYEFVDTLILNLAEAKTVTRKNEIKDIVYELNGMVNLAIITMAKEGCIIGKDRQYTHIAAKALDNVVDTTGAGDAFSAGFIVGKLRNMTEVECAELGHEVAANFLKQKGG